jgi:5'-3' exonuclease
MGIPSYFKHIILNHRPIIKELNTLVEKKETTLTNLYLDSNSIIYDVVHSFESEDDDPPVSDPPVSDPPVSDSLIIQRVIDKIIYYINLVKPTGRIIVAFDGVAPMAKIKQQRNRRYLSSIQNAILNPKKKWDTTAITPGTEFMENLSKTIENRFKSSMSEFNVEFLKISTSNECGEGEHKIYKYIRSNPEYHINTTTIIYGLDADLIMLSLTHLCFTKQIFLFRDTPHFISGMDNTLDAKKNYVMDILELSREIIFEMTGRVNINTNANRDANILVDYIFICFFLGNDFMPHFPALNIRNGGINKLIESYRHVISTDNMYLCNKNSSGRMNVNWKVLRKMVEHLSSKELEYILDEYKKRNKTEIYLSNHNNNKNNKIHSDKEYKLSNIPKQNREIEKYINIDELGWEKRYYKTLFDIDIDDIRQREICVHYLEGLEWNINYYVNGCINWKWYYPYCYPPLLKDLFKYIPVFDTKLIEERVEEPLHPLVQLSYVIPSSSLYLLPERIKSIFNKNPDCFQSENDCPTIIWAFCSYFWESHVKLKDIDIEKLAQLCKI